jgi:hypothetical protein
MAGTSLKTLFALDCGATNWRLYRADYKHTNGDVSLLGEPQPSPLTSFSERRLPAVLCLNPEGKALEGFGEIAQQQLEQENSRERVREYFKPCIGSHLEESPLAHQKRYTHTQAMQYTRMLLEAVLDQIRQEKWRAQPFDDRLWFTFAYPIHWRYDHEGKIFEEYRQLVEDCFGDDFKQIRFVAEPEGAILGLQNNGLLERQTNPGVTLIIDVGGSTTDFVAGEIDPVSGKLDFLGRHGAPFGGGLYDAELAKYIAVELNIPATALADDPSALVSLRISGQRLKESLSRQMLFPGKLSRVHQRTVTLVMPDGTVYRRTVALGEAQFNEVTNHLNQAFAELMDYALQKMSLETSRVGQVVLVGGGSQLFTITNHLRERFGPERVVLADNPDEIVVQGIGLEYGFSFEHREPTISVPLPAPNNPPPEIPGATESQWSLLAGTQSHPVLPGRITLGRAESSDIQVDDIKASRLHAEIRLSGQGLEIIDLGSTNGTYVNGKRIPAHEPYALQAGDKITIGKIKFLVANDTR